MSYPPEMPQGPPSALDDEAAWQALLARDAAADGRVYVGVTSTGIYCRPICRVRTPRRDRCRFFASAAQAEAAAFRPCLKCRPEIAPGPGLAWSMMDASRTLAVQAARRLDAEASSTATAEVRDGDGGAIARMASRLGVSDRHLRRIFAAEHGVSPLQYLQTKRLLLAKQLLTDTTMPVTQVALASGFASLRRFNAAFAASYRMSPTRLRRGTGAGPGRPDAPADDDAFDGMTMRLAFRPAFDRAGLLEAIAARAIDGVEQVDGTTIRRTARAGVFGAAAGWIEAAFDARQSLVHLRCDIRLAPGGGVLLQAVRCWLGLDAAGLSDAEAAAASPPGAIDPFEWVVCASLGRHATVATVRALGGRLAARLGEPMATPWNADARCFPSPGAVAGTTTGELAAIGIGGTQADALRRLARDWPALLPLSAPGAVSGPLADRLVELHGFDVGAADELACRALGWPRASSDSAAAIGHSAGPSLATAPSACRADGPGPTRRQASPRAGKPRPAASTRRAGPDERTVPAAPAALDTALLSTSGNAPS